VEEAKCVVFAEVLEGKEEKIYRELYILTAKRRAVFKICCDKWRLIIALIISRFKNIPNLLFCCLKYMKIASSQNYGINKPYCPAGSLVLECILYKSDII
jgi:hypothetical protein